MSRHRDALLRQWSMLRLVPRYPAKITVQALRQKLADDGFEITQRSLQRDLNELSSAFPIACDDREKPYGWNWQKDAPSFDLPGLTPAQALTLAMAEQHLQNLLPAPMLEQLRPYFRAARQRLTTSLMGRLDRAALRRFDYKVRVDYMRTEQSLRMFKRMLDGCGIAHDENSLADMARMSCLIPGDFALVGRRHAVAPFANAREVLDALGREVAMRADGPRRIGFV